MTTTNLDPYATLGIPFGASRAEAASAHRRLAKRYHPDVNPGAGAAERMRRINQAWRILSDPVRRSRYDAARAARPPTSNSRGTGARTTATWEPWPDDRPRATYRRPVRKEPLAPTAADRPVVLLAVWLLLGLLYVIGAWLGSLAP